MKPNQRSAWEHRQEQEGHENERDMTKLSTSNREAQAPTDRTN